IPRDCEEMALILPRCDKNDAPLLDGDNELLPVAPPIARAPTALDQVDKLETEHVFNPRPTGEHQPRHILTHGVVHSGYVPMHRRVVPPTRGDRLVSNPSNQRGANEPPQ